MKKAASISLRADIMPRDVEQMIRWMENPLITRYLNEDPHVAGHLRRLLDTVPGPMLGFHFNRGCRFFLICDKAGRSIGFVKLKQLGDRPVYEIVFAIGEERLWGNGYGTAAIRAAIAKAFLELRAEKVIARIYSANSRSINSVRACGFCCEHRGEPLCRYSATMAAYLRQLA